MSRIKFLIMDVDGTLTDGKIYISPQGECMKAFNVKDGYGIAVVLKKYDIEPIIITGRRSDILSKRCEELGIVSVYQNVANKRECIKKILDLSRLNEVAYIGDDENDIEAISLINEHGGETGCPFDAVEDVINKVNYVCKIKGGEGSVREFINHIISLP